MRPASGCGDDNAAKSPGNKLFRKIRGVHQTAWANPCKPLKRPRNVMEIGSKQRVAIALECVEVRWMLAVCDDVECGMENSRSTSIESNLFFIDAALGFVLMKRFVVTHQR